MNNNGAGPSASSPSQPPYSSRHGLPPGYRFKPSDHELMLHLFHKIGTGAALMPDIKDVNLYAYDPQTLANTYPPVGDDEWYFFTPTRRKNQKGKRPDRKAGNGFWRAMTADKELRLEDQNVGRKLSLVFHVGEYKDGVRTSWLMHEYRVEDGFHVPTHANDRTLMEWVLCKVYQNTRTVKANKRQRREENSLQIGRVPAAGRQELNNGDDDEDDSRALMNNRQRREFDHHPQFLDQIMMFNQAATAAEFNNGSATPSGSMMTMGQHRHHDQTVLFNQAAADFNNGSIDSRSMVMAGQRHHHTPCSHQTLFDLTINANYQLEAAGGSQELYNGGEGSSSMAGGDMGTLFNPQNYYDRYLDQTSLFNTYPNHQAAAAAGSQELFNGSHRVEMGSGSSYGLVSPQQISAWATTSFDQSAVPNSNVNVEARGGSEGLDNGGGKATPNYQEHCPPPSLDQTVADKNKDNGNVEGAEMEGFYINERGHCIMNGERVEMGEYLNPHHHSRLPPSNCNSTDISTFDYFINFDDPRFKDS